MTTERNPYRVLGLTVDASQTQIVRAYRRLLHAHHPDTRTPSPTTDPVADEELQRILAAYALLRDPARRAAYDRAAAEDPGPAPNRSPAQAPRHPASGTRRVRVVVRRGTPRRAITFSLRIGPLRRHR
ncbi:J domain-containing protein [Rhodococcus pseudokoreensis]|uniref:J domain-containing protein n=1 Tax=Rhodococcus pseudokoreensis TaxID=2811421 RepID=A0A974ZV50_9NOCA|nr:J domain-containing protein [Rhodococcus pseudokoreensis]QSE91479.1 J domain-containing protein [Rhodococcus pseudokoreensis]